MGAMGNSLIKNKLIKNKVLALLEQEILKL
jgi:hypothetical protein